MAEPPLSRLCGCVKRGIDETEREKGRRGGGERTARQRQKNETEKRREKKERKWRETDTSREREEEIDTAIEEEKMKRGKEAHEQ